MCLLKWQNGGPLTEKKTFQKGSEKWVLCAQHELLNKWQYEAQFFPKTIYSQIILHVLFLSVLRLLQICL